MLPATARARFARLRPYVRVAASVILACTLLVGIAGCAIPTAETAPVPSVATTPPPVEATPAAPETPPPAEKPPAPVSAVKLIPATVVRIVDGDTAVFRLADGTQEKVRFIGVDTPESTTKIEPYGKAASAYTSEHLSVGMPVYLEKDVEARDRYGRLLAYIWLSPPTAINESELRGKLFNAQLAIDGYAQQMTIAPNVKYADYFRDFVAEARSRSRGLWSGDAAAESPAVVAPPVPAKPKAAASGAYIGNRNTKKFHIPSCSSVSDMNPANQVALASRDAAISQGYVPCKRCRP